VDITVVVSGGKIVGTSREPEAPYTPRTLLRRGDDEDYIIGLVIPRDVAFVVPVEQFHRLVQRHLPATITGTAPTATV
jgi:hypothetical protein